MTSNILQQLHQQIAQVESLDRLIDIVVVDDGSTDGTVEIIQQHFPQVVLIQGDGNLWWTGAICKGMQHIVQHFNSDYIVWLNDDIVLNKDFIINTLKICHIESIQDSIVGGIVKSQSYPNWIVFGGFNQGNQVCNLGDFSENNLIEIDAINGNIAIIPIKVINKIGLPNIKKYQHYGGDYEYGIRAKKAGFKVMLSNQLQATADYQIEDFIRYMSPLLQWYLKPNWKNRIKILQGLTSLKAHYNIWHLVNMIHFDQDKIPLKKYLAYYYREIRQLLLCDFRYKQKCEQDLKHYIQQRQAPPEMAEAVLNMRN